MNEIDILQLHIEGRLRQVPYFTDIAIAAPRLFKDADKLTTPKTINDRIDRVLVGLEKTNDKIGAAIRVLQPVFNVPDKNLPGPRGGLIVPVRCQVHPIYNFSAAGTNKDVTSIAIEVIRQLHNFPVNILGGRLYADGDTIVPYFDEEKQLMTAEVLVNTKCQFAPREDVKLPTFSLANNFVTLTNLTPGAFIMYTKNIEKFPSDYDPDVPEYTAPFSVAAGDKIQWAAYASGMSGSEVGYKLIT